MKKITSWLLIYSLLLSNGIPAADKTISSSHIQTPHNNEKQQLHQTIPFRYENEELVDIINSLAAKSNTNILLPQGADAIKNKVTFFIEQPVTLSQAWKILDTILQLAGYTRITQHNMFVIKKTTETITREPCPLFVGVPPEQLPETEQPIRYLYYLSNIKLSEGDNDLTKLLSAVMPKNSYKVDKSTNGLIFSAPAIQIKATMKIVQELDKAGFAEKLEIMHLRYASADVIAKLFNENILKTTTGYNRYRLDAKKQAEATYFSKNARVMSAQKHLGINALILVGRTQAVDRIKRFINTYLDIELESGKSVLHVYQLQYLDSDTVRDVLQEVVNAAKGTSPTGQSKTAPVNKTGTARTFGEVIIQSDKSTDEQAKYFGGNKLLVAARNDDWLVLKGLIEKLDQPRPQVLMEIIIADLTFEDLKQLSSSLRNLDKIPMPGDVNYQSGHLRNGQGVILDANNKSLNADLLRLLPQSSGNPISQAAGSTHGSTVFSFNDNDGRSWGISQILKSINKGKVLSAPHVIAINGQEALVKLGQERLLPDESIGTSGSTTIKTKWVEANLEVKLTPRISSEAKTINMQVDIMIKQYLGSNTSERSVRNIVTNTNVKDKDVLAIGGLIRTDTADSIRKTPILGDVPILGWFFKGRQKRINKTNLTVFISPIIIEPHLRRGMSPETKTSVKLMKAFAQEGQLFDYLKEPITRLFFTSNLDNTAEEIDKFTEVKEVATQKELAQSDKNDARKKKTRVASNKQPKAERVNEIKKLVQNEQNPLLRAKSG